MKNNEIFRHFSAILDNMLQDDYWKFYFQEPFQREYGEWLDDDKSLLITNGCSRGCLVDDNYDWIVKFPICSDNACEREITFYNMARKQGLASCFTECNFIGNYRKKIKYFRADNIFQLCPSIDNDDWIEEAATICDMEDIVIEIPLYAYLKANDCYIPWSLSKEDKAIGDKIKSPIAEYHMDVAVALWKNWGENLFWKFDTFCRLHCINDLHSGNIGEIDGNLVILDYAGYKE